uniref:Single-stranded DNA-binding protein, mitochondrial n=1 Tax=Meloidogyne incognita TaxID=6306 RepID=A0A914LXN9_MELIC
MSIVRIFSRSIRPIMGLRQASTDISQLFEQSEQPKGQPVYQDDMESNQQSGGYGSAYPQPQRRINKGVNRVELLGGVAGDPVYKVTQRGSEFASFNLYTNVDRKLGNGNIVTNTEVHNVVAFGGVAKYIQQNLHRGSRVYITGRLHYNGGMLLADGTRTPRMASINVENVYPLARSLRRDSATQEEYQQANDTEV